VPDPPGQSRRQQFSLVMLNWRGPSDSHSQSISDANSPAAGNTPGILEANILAGKIGFDAFQLAACVGIKVPRFQMARASLASRSAVSAPGGSRAS